MQGREREREGGDDDVSISTSIFISIPVQVLDKSLRCSGGIFYLSTLN